jgi:hypothetical protein
VTFIFVLAAAMASPVLWPRLAAAVFTVGPSVRVSPNTIFDIRWIASFVGTGKVEIFADPKGPGAGPPIDTKFTSGSGNDHTITFGIGGLLKADTTYYFRITHKDPTGGNADLTNDPVPPATNYPSVATGAQTIGDVFVDAGADRAMILWDANVIGAGRVDYGTASPDELSVTDQQNVTSHSIELTGLAPGTTYHFRVCNRHAIDGDCLAAKTGSLTTLPSPPQVVQAIDDLRERVASYGLQRGTARSLDAKLEASLNAWQAGDAAGACNALSAFLNEVRAQAGNKLTEAQAQQLTAAANDIRAQIGC